MKTIHIKPIRSEQDLTEALARIDEIIDAEPNTPEYEELTLLGDLVYAYENIHHPIDPPDPIDLLNSKIEEGEITKEELFEVIPNRSVRSSICARRRRMPVKVMYKVMQYGWVPAESFFTPAYFEKVS